MVKFNVAIVEPPVRFRACACSFFDDFIFLKIIPHFFRPKNPFDKPWSESDGVWVRTYYHEYGPAQVSGLCFRSYADHCLLSCVTLIALYRPLEQKDSNNWLPMRWVGWERWGEGWTDWLHTWHTPSFNIKLVTAITYDGLGTAPLLPRSHA